MTGPTRRETQLAVFSASAFAVVLSWVLIGGNLRSVFGPIDDHEPLTWMGSDGRFGLSEVLPTLLGDTEVGRFGATPRYRPAYYLFRLLQTTIFGDDPRLWYCSVAVLYVGTIATLGVVTWIWLRNTGTILPRVTRVVFAVGAPLLGVLLFGTIPAWSGVATRLGPSELLAMLGVSLVALGATRLAQGASAWWWVPTLIGVVSAAWSKENFLPLSAIVFGIGIYRFATRGRNWPDLCLSVVSLLPSIVLVAALSGITAQGGRDVYGGQVGAGRFSSSLQALLGTYRWYWLPAAAAVVIAAVIWTVAVWRASRTSVLLVWWVISVSVGWLVFDAWVYSGVYALPRYWMVFQFLKVVAVIGALSLSLSARAAAGVPWISWSATAVVVASGALALVQVASAPTGMTAIRSAVEVNASATASWRSGVDETVALMATGGPGRLVIVVSQPVDYEPVIALAGEVRRRSPGASVAVTTSFTAEQAGSTLGAALNDISELGQAERGIVPLADVLQGGPVTCAFLNSSAVATEICSPGTSARVDAQAM